MSFFDSVKSIAESCTGNGDHAAVAGGLLQEMESAGGVSGLIQSLQQNGAGGLIQQWANGNTQSADPSAIEQGLSNTGLVDSIAARTGMSPDTVRSGLATVLPMLIHHVTSNGHVTTDGEAADNPLPESGSLLQSVLGKFI